MRAVRQSVVLLAVLAVLAAMLATSCRQKSALEFYGLEADYNILVTRLGDAAFAEAEMTGIVLKLQAIPPDTIEAPKARALLEQYERATARIATEKRAAQQALAVQPPKKTVTATPTPVISERPTATLCHQPGWASGVLGYRAALELQQSQKCPVVLYFFASWCPYCKQFNSSIKPDSSVDAALVTATKVQIDAEGIEAERALAKQYHVTGYPSLVVLASPQSKPRRIRAGVGGTMAPAPQQFIDDYKETVRVNWANEAIDDLAANRVDEALERTDRVIALDPTYANAYAIRGDALKRTGDTAASERAYAAACKAGCARCCRR